MSCAVFAVWRPCFVRVLSTVYVMCCFCCLATMFRVGFVNSVCHVLCLLSGDHASCGSCRQCMSCVVFTVWQPCFVRVLSTVYVMCCVCYLVIMFVRELLTVYIMYYCCCHILTLPSGNHASCRYLMLLWPSGNHASCQHFVIYILLVLSVRSSYCYRLFIWLCTYINDCMTV